MTEAWDVTGGMWSIAWTYPVRGRAQDLVILPLGICVAFDLDVWVQIPAGATGYRLYPTPDGEEGSVVRPLPFSPEWMARYGAGKRITRTDWHR